MHVTPSNRGDRDSGDSEAEDSLGRLCSKSDPFSPDGVPILQLDERGVREWASGSAAFHGARLLFPFRSIGLPFLSPGRSSSLRAALVCFYLFFCFFLSRRLSFAPGFTHRLIRRTPVDRRRTCVSSPSLFDPFLVLCFYQLS